MKTDDNKYLFLLILLSLVFLALNSILCKAALLHNSIDPYSFTFFRLLFAMIMLLSIYFYRFKSITFIKNKNWLSSFMLFVYAISFSYAYINIDAGFGALLLFGVVQVVMVVSSLFHKEKLTFLKIAGLFLSLTGLIYLIYPKDSFEVSLPHALLMILAGIAWALYSVLGKKSIDAIGNTTDNFIKACLYITIFYFIFTVDTLYITQEGLLLAIISGAITSALGYIIWYQVLPQIKIVTASVIQLFVPIIAIGLSVLFLNESLTLDLIISTIIVTVGIVLTIFSKKQATFKA